MAKIKLDDVEYDTEDMSDNAKAQLASLQFNEAHINRLKNELAIATAVQYSCTIVNIGKKYMIAHGGHAGAYLDPTVKSTFSSLLWLG